LRIGDVVRVRATGREGQIVEDVGNGRRRVEFYPAAGTAPSRPSDVPSDEAGGIFSDQELEPVRTAHEAD
jgi:hypothetical protein